MKSESAELVSGLIRQYRRLRLLYLGYLAAAVLALVFFFVDKRVTLALVAASLVYHLVVVPEGGEGLPAGLCPRLRPVYPGPAPSGRPPHRSAHPGGGGAAPRPPGRRQRRQGLCPGAGGRLRYLPRPPCAPG